MCCVVFAFGSLGTTHETSSRVVSFLLYQYMTLCVFLIVGRRVYRGSYAEIGNLRFSTSAASVELVAGWCVESSSRCSIRSFSDRVSSIVHTIANSFAVQVSHRYKKRRGQTDLSSIVDLDDYRQQLRNGQTCGVANGWSSSSADIGTRLPSSSESISISLSVPGKVDPRVVAARAQQSRDNTPSPFPYSFIVPSCSFLSA
jgi:hypothetical protein